MSRESLFWSRVDRRGPDECWPWTLSLDRDGYGSFGSKSARGKAHRWALAYWAGAEHPDCLGGDILHKCDNPRCCNPSHMSIGTSADNSRDCSEKGRTSRGEVHYAAKLTERDVRSIHSDARPVAVVAEQYGISKALVHKICGGSVWEHLGLGRSSVDRRKFSPAQIVAIRADERPQSRISEDYGCSQMLVSRIKRREVYRDVG